MSYINQGTQYMFGSLCRGLLHCEGYKTKLSNSQPPLLPGLACHTDLAMEMQAALSEGFFPQGKVMLLRRFWLLLPFLSSSCGVGLRVGCTRAGQSRA